MTLATIDLAPLVDAAHAAALDGRDLGAIRRLVWSELGSDAVDHAVVCAVSDGLRELEAPDRGPPRDRAHGMVDV
jgi:hypothetical protein